MINLLSPNDRRQLTAARTNSLLLRYTLLLGVVIILLLAEIGGAYVVLSAAKASDEQTITENENKSKEYASTKKELASFTTDLSDAKYILSQQVNYTGIILRIAAVLPSDAVIEKLTIDPVTFGTPTSITVQTTSYQRAKDIKASLQNSRVFTDVNIQSVNETDDKTFPFTVTYNVTYSKDLLTQS